MKKIGIEKKKLKLKVRSLQTGNLGIQNRKEVMSSYMKNIIENKIEKPPCLQSLSRSWILQYKKIHLVMK